MKPAKKVAYPDSDGKPIADNRLNSDDVQDREVRRVECRTPTLRAKMLAHGFDPHAA